MVHPNDNANDHPQTYDADDSGIRSGNEVLDIDASDERRPVTHRIVNGPDEYRYCKHTQRPIDCRLTHDVQTFSPGIISPNPNPNPNIP